MQNTGPSGRRRQLAQMHSSRLRTRARGPYSAAGAAGNRDSLLMAVLLWIQIIYMVIPRDIFLPAGEKLTLMSANPVSRVIKFALLIISFFIICKRIAESRQLLQHLNSFFRLFLILVPLSYFWSISAGDTLARFISIISVVAVSVAFCVDGWHRSRFQNVLRPVITLVLIGSVIFGLIAPDLAIEHGEGTLKNSWHGLAAQKNLFGQLATFGLILWLHGGLSKEVKPWRALAGVVLSFSCVLLSRSSTSLMAALFVCVLQWMLLRSPAPLRRYMPYLVSLFAILVLTYAMAVLNLIPGTSLLLEPITAITGKDMTFSNRSEIWRIIKEHIQYSPVLGSGYGAYWIGPVPSSPSFTFLAQMYFYPTESHNGYLEIVNDLGYAGMICLFGFMIAYLRQALRLMQVDRSQAVLFLAIFFQQAIVNLSESCWLAINSGFIFALVTLAVCSLARAEIDVQQPAYARIFARALRRGRPRRQFASATVR